MARSVCGQRSLDGLLIRYAGWLEEWHEVLQQGHNKLFSAYLKELGIAHEFLSIPDVPHTAS